MSQENGPSDWAFGPGFPGPETVVPDGALLGLGYSVLASALSEGSPGAPASGQAGISASRVWARR